MWEVFDNFWNCFLRHFSSLLPPRVLSSNLFPCLATQQHLRAGSQHTHLFCFQSLKIFHFCKVAPSPLFLCSFHDKIVIFNLMLWSGRRLFCIVFIALRAQSNPHSNAAVSKTDTLYPLWFKPPMLESWLGLCPQLHCQKTKNVMVGTVNNHHALLWSSQKHLAGHSWKQDVRLDFPVVWSSTAFLILLSYQ